MMCCVEVSNIGNSIVRCCCFLVFLEGFVIIYCVVFMRICFGWMCFEEGKISA